MKFRTIVVVIVVRRYPRSTFLPPPRRGPNSKSIVVTVIPDYNPEVNPLLKIFDIKSIALFN